MKNYFKYSILISLAIIMILTIAPVLAIPTLGTTAQPTPFESSPTVNTTSGTTTATRPTLSTVTSMYDGDLTTSGQVKVTLTTTTSPAWLQLATFTTQSDPGKMFTPGWVDIKISYSAAATTDDTWAIQYAVGASAWTNLHPATTAAFYAGSSATRAWAQVAEPTDGVWDWADVGSLKIRIIFTKVGTAWDTTKDVVIVYEAWADVYPLPTPPTPGPTYATTVSVQPPEVIGVSANPGITGLGNQFFVDVYVQNVADMFNYEFTLDFDPTVCTPTGEYILYYPWTALVTADLTPGNSYAYVASGMPPPVPVGTAFTGSSPIARIYFSAVGAGTTNLTFKKGAAELILGDSYGVAINRDIYDGYFSSPRYLSFTGGIYPGGDPTGTTWHEDYPVFSNLWHVVGWIDNGDLTLSPSDQLSIDVGGVVRQYHVDQITTTIHWTFKPLPSTEVGAADPEDPTMTELPTDPTTTRWHQIYPVYCRTFTITGWTDNGNGFFDPSDQFEITYDDTAEVASAHLDAVTTNILVSQKPGGPVPEFPFGITAMITLAAAMPIVYMWRTKRKVIRK
jgi:hypothetical protein